MAANGWGIHLLVWGAGWHLPGFDLPRVLHDIAALGFAGVELPLLEPVSQAALRSAAVAARAEGLWLTASTALPPGLSLVEGDGVAAAEWLGAMTEAAAVLGAPVLCGPMLAPVGDLPAGPGRSYRAAVEGLRTAAARARSLGVRLCVEPLNRFETDTLNTLAQGAELCGLVGDGLSLLADTFHQNIEEADPLDALARHMTQVGHVHCSENHRGPIGSGHIPWAEVVAVLRGKGYSGRMVVEGFNARVPQLARATCLWRPLADSPEAFAARSAEYLRGL